MREYPNLQSKSGSRRRWFLARLFPLLLPPAARLKFIINLYPPYLGTGIVVKNIAPDFSRIQVEMGMHWYNRNYVRTHFGGSLYAMCDPFYMLMLIQILGKSYIIWDKTAHIEFIKPGAGNISALFTISAEQIAEIKAAAASGKRLLYDFYVDIKDEQDGLVARVQKTLYIKKKT